ncbi:protein-tyrosine phosphatase [Hespellia stercorisuis DSM 15480]|uniref:protein-tyrosine-phosphatase n=2 Tax=Hespellia stercorisuis TaxID=180311 RepID=A0A1M6UK60_9FIRM|nr:protein-tyrosine phosphatase [Hespellia stercorisuis DSM 15480]
MAEFVMKDMIQKRGLTDQFHIASAATSMEEIGNPVHPGTRRKLAEHGIRTDGKRAVQLRRTDYEKYDYLIAMEQYNIRRMQSIVGKDPDNKICCLLDFSEHPRDIADPWYSGNFDVTYDDIVEGCEAMLQKITDLSK